MSNSTMNPDFRTDEWNQAAENAKEAAATVGKAASHAAAATGAMASQAVSDVGRRADDMAARAGAGLQELGDRLGRQSPQSGILGSASQGLAEAVRSSGQYVEKAKLSGMSDDLADIIRRNPLPSVLIAICVGWFVARKL